MDKMNAFTVSRYLKQENNALGLLLNQLKQHERWNNLLQKALPEIDSLTQHCQLVRYENQQLFMVTDSPHWVMKIRFHIPELIKYFRQFPEFFTLQAIHCKAKPLFMKNYAKKILAKPLALSAENATMLRAAAEKISDKKLREALEKIAKHIE